MTTRRRLDAELVRRGLARSRQEAADLIASGAVLVDRVAASKSATQVTDGVSIAVEKMGPLSSPAVRTN